MSNSREPIRNSQAAEQRYLDDVVQKIRQAEKKAQSSIEQAETDKRSINKQFGEEVKLNYGDYATNLETALSIHQQQQMLAERENSWQESTKRLSILRRLIGNPYFARLDFQEHGEPKRETIYIGLSSFSDKNDKFLIYDWRAPISSIYYDGKLGDVTYQTPDGEQSVNISLKRQFLIKKGQIDSMFDTAETIGDQMLLEVLGEKSSTQMKSIVTTIQKEQNKIIRNTSADLLFVQGAAGSGKTSAILQRVAYLLYRYRGNLTSSQVVMFSPNQLFNDYIENVLPELGEQNMVQMTYQQFVGRRLPNYTIVDPTAQFEVPQTETAKKISKVKTELKFFKALQAYSRTLESHGMFFRDLKFQGKPYLTKEKIEEIYYSFNQNYHLGNRVDATKERLVQLLNNRVEPELRKSWVSKTIEGLDPEQLQAMYARADQEFSSSDAEYKYLARKIVTQALKPVNQGINRMRFFNINKQYLHFLAQVPQFLDLSDYGLTAAEWQAGLLETQENFKAHAIHLDDVSPYLFLFDLMTGKRGDRRMRFVFVDEIQDYTPFQLAYLQFQFPKAKYTMLGDLNQAIFTKTNSRSLLSQVQKLFDRDKTEVVQLTRSYRSTKPITEFTRAILKNGKKIDTFEREGDLPNAIVRDDQDQLGEDLLAQLKINDDRGVTTAIICKTKRESEILTKFLQSRDYPVTLIRSESQRLAAGTLVLPAYLAKGLEFDAVILWELSAANYPDEDDRQLVYTLASRAMHRLTMLATNQLTPLLEIVPEKLYVNEK
ncbi:DNA helicase [Lapidilactobacillus concavus DSM 17758]|uniref:DNA helicase n=1 Tax=Lapidilactobacillus concavus DSM 17758 TaxID=1423735 RepID=A0A0R1W0Q5_9LACO|nr:RNA polymerase recycling motor HelD [Lapidilactobacillus concavus]KRM09460.1 DNA helicase [Lapidilactobacillus concavus DSM 17758]GEL13990.1 DNA helicase [Lapidilactobacillus concavus]